MQPDAASHHRPTSHRDLSPTGQVLFTWLRNFARAVKLARLYRLDNPLVAQVRENVGTSLEEIVAQHGTVTLRFTAREIRLENEIVVRPFVPLPGVDPPPPNPEDYLPFLFYRDGIRALQVVQGVPRSDFEALFEAVRLVGHGGNTQDDLLTLMWQANLTHIKVDAVPLEQTIYLSSRKARRKDPFGNAFRALAFNWAPSGEEIRADLGQVKGAQGLHRDTFDDWDLPLQPADPVKAYRLLLSEVDIAQSFLMASWAEERDRPWNEEAPAFLRHLLETDPGDDTRSIAARSAMSWVVNSIHRTAWPEASESLVLLREFDPELRFVSEELAERMKELPLEEVVEQLDEAEPEDQARFAALVVGLGPAAVDLAITAMSLCNRSRTRAAACAALCYVCNDDPMLLASAINDPRWYVVRNAVFVLGQVGGPDVVDLLEIAGRHPEPRVRRQVVQSLGNVPTDQRLPLLLSHLGTRDPQLLSATFNMLARDRNPRALKVLLERFASPNFEYVAEWIHRTYEHALEDWVGETDVPLLASLVERGGWLAAPSPVRNTAAQMLQRIGSETAAAALEAGLRSKHEPVREACLAAMSERNPR
ncbi:MAG: HEAT repeat domain-containing protein [Candidatus Eisenbacteria bacterium]